MPDDHEQTAPDDQPWPQRLAAVQAELAAARAELARLLPVPAPLPTLVPIPVVAPRVSWLRRAMLSAYRIVRPVARPLAHRGRRFMTVELMTELSLLRGKQDDILERLIALEPKGDDGSAAHLARMADRLLLTLALESRRP